MTDMIMEQKQERERRVKLGPRGGGGGQQPKAVDSSASWGTAVQDGERAVQGRRTV